MSAALELQHRLDGPEDAPVLVLSNSLGSTYAMWDDQIAALAERFRVLRYDHRGHGGSPVPNGPYAIADLGQDVLALLDRLGLERVSFCGLSLGGMVGMWLASEAPERIDRLVLCCTLPHFPPPEMWDERADMARTEGMASLLDATIERWLPEEFRRSRPEAAERLRAMVRMTPREGYAGCCEAIRDMDLRPALARIEAPTLVIAGEADPSTPAEQVQAIADAIDGARFEVLAGAAHLANVARPDAFTRAMLEHLSA
jgi:3-oxoadipate enol-lactonase